jgi:hypothetical protein
VVGGFKHLPTKWECHQLNWRFSLEDWLMRRNPEFEASAKYVLAKNAQLYGRLAGNETNE